MLYKIINSHKMTFGPMHHINRYRTVYVKLYWSSTCLVFCNQNVFYKATKFYGFLHWLYPQFWVSNEEFYGCYQTAHGTINFCRNIFLINDDLSLTLHAFCEMIIDKAIVPKKYDQNIISLILTSNSWEYFLAAKHHNYFQNSKFQCFHNLTHPKLFHPCLRLPSKLQFKAHF